MQTTNSIILPAEQHWLLERMKALGFSPEKGVCFGVALMGGQAFLANEIPLFNKRLGLIFDIPRDEFVKRIQNLTQRRLELIKKIKEEIGAPNNDELKEFENNNTIQIKIEQLKQTINDLIMEEKLQEKDRENEFSRRKALLLFNAFVQQKINQAASQLSFEEQIQLDIPSFFTGVEIYQKGLTFKNLNLAYSKTQSAIDSSSLILSKKLDDKGGITQLTPFSGAYTLDELNEYLKGLQAACLTLTNSFFLTLNSDCHSITLGYNPNTKEWCFIDANSLPAWETRDINQLSKAILHSFFDKRFAIFNTSIFCYKKDEAALTNCQKIWQGQDSFKKIHKVTTEKAKWIDSLYGSWLINATKIEDRNLIKKLLEAKANPNPIHERDTPLFIAAEMGNVAIVKLLLKAGAMVNKIRKRDHSSALLVAAQNGHLTVVKQLLKANADVNQASSDHYYTPLFLAAYNGHAQVVKALLEANANVNQAEKGGCTPLYIAVKNGHHEIVKSLLEHGADRNPTINIDINYLKTLATTPEIKEAINTLIKRKTTIQSASQLFPQ